MRRRNLSPEGREPVGAYTAKQLHEFLVADAVRSHATWLPWAVAAYSRIGEQTKQGAEAAYTAVLDEVETLTGLRRMPVGKPLTKRELRELQQPT